MTSLRFSGGPIHTPAGPVEALLVEDDRVVERTTDRPVEIDLRGRCVLPAFNDAHVHFPS